MKDLAKIAAVIAAAIAIKKLLESKTVCVYTPGGFKICNR